MEVMKNSGMMVTSSPKSSCSKKSKQMKRKQSFDESHGESLVLLSTIANITMNESSESEKPVEIEVVTDDELDSDSSDTSLSPVEMSSESSDIMGEEIDTSMADMQETYANVNTDLICTYKQENFDDILATAEKEVEEEEEMEEVEKDYGLFYEKKNEYRNKVEKMPRKKRKLNIQTGSIKIEPLFSKNQTIVLIDHPGSITLYQYVSVQVLSGKVSVWGKELTAKCDAIKVFSSETTGLVELITQSCENIWMKKSSYDSVVNLLAPYVETKAKAVNILKSINPTTVIVALEGCFYEPNLQFLELYYPNVLRFNQKMFGKKSFVEPIAKLSGVVPRFGKNSYCFKDIEAKSVNFNEDCEDLAADIIHAMQVAGKSVTCSNANWPRILVYGPKNTGKSTLLRFLMNKALSVYTNIYCLDADPGQTEFTPPGVVSLTRVKHHVIGPPFCHSLDPVSMCFTGAISADLSPEMYSNSVNKMMNTFKHEMEADGTLFVNTMGWVKGIGQKCLVKVMQIVKPTIVIEIVNTKDNLMFDYRQGVAVEPLVYQIDCPEYKLPKLNAKETRNLSLFSYFGRCQSTFKRPTYLNSFRPFRVCWDAIPVYNFKRKLAPYRLIESMNSSFVALCKVNPDVVLAHTNDKFPMTLETEPDNTCIGFGIVRAVDEVQHLLYIVTPLTEEELENVNAIIKGNITIPEPFILEQPISETSLYFTNMEDVAVKESVFEGDQSNQDVNDITGKYRKGIKKRYGKSKKRN